MALSAHEPVSPSDDGDVQVRPYHPSDLPTLQAIADRAWQEIHQVYRRQYGDELYRQLCPDDATRKGQQVQDHCRQHPHWVYVAQQGDRILGFATFCLDDHRKIGEIGNNAVDREAGVKGVGQKLYQAIFDQFARQGMRWAKVQTGLDEAHAPARRAYERAGFDRRSESVTYYRDLSP